MPEAFAADIVHLLSETSMLDRLRAEAKVSVKNFSVEKMVEIYLDGLGALISSGPRAHQRKALCLPISEYLS